MHSPLPHSLSLLRHSGIEVKEFLVSCTGGNIPNLTEFPSLFVSWSSWVGLPLELYLRIEKLWLLSQALSWSEFIYSACC